MKLWFAIVALLLCAAPRLSAATPEDQYLAIYFLIQEGDAASNAGRPGDALPRYQDALRSLERLQRANPGWQTVVVNFRLRYLNERIAALTAAGAGTAPIPAVAGAPPSAAAAPDEVARQMAELRQEVLRLQTENSTLQSKLREALAVQPAVTDPRELARAEARARELAGENEQLRLRLAEARQEAAADTNAAALADLRRQLADESKRAATLAAGKAELQDRLGRATTSPRDDSARAAAQRRLAEAGRELEEQRARAALLLRANRDFEARVKALEPEAAAAASLRAENTLLRQQAAGLQAGAGAGVQQRLQAAEAQITSLLSERSVLQLERAALENRMQRFATGAAPPPAPPVETGTARRVRELTMEREELQRQLAAARRADETAAQLATMRARIEALEASPVPYSAEELALFRVSAPQLAAADAPARPGPAAVPRPPAGAGPLVAEARRHFLGGDLQRAENIYRQILLKDEQNVFTLANLAAILIESGRLDEAEAALQQALRAAPDDPHSLQLQGYLKFHQGNYDAALDALSRAARLNPDNAEVQNYLGVTLSQKGQRAAAETALRRALQIDPAYARAHHNLAVIYAAQEPPAVALARWHYRKALEGGHSANPDLERFFQKQETAAQP